MFARIQPDKRWAQLAADTYVVLSRVANPSAGLVPDWTTDAGVAGGDLGYAPCRGAGNNEAKYGYDAARTPWRIATDWLWFQTPEAKAFLTPLTNWVSAQPITEIGDRYTLDGIKEGQGHKPTFLGGFGLGAMAVDDSVAIALLNEMQATKSFKYFDDTLRAVYLAFASGLFAQPTCV